MNNSEKRINQKLQAVRDACHPDVWLLIRQLFARVDELEMRIEAVHEQQLNIIRHYYGISHDTNKNRH